LVVADIADVEAVTSTCKEHGVTQAVHFAAYKSVGESMEQPTKYFTNNVAGTVTLVDTLLANGVTDLVFSSSCSVNGTPATNPVDEEAPVLIGAAVRRLAIVERILGCRRHPRLADQPALLNAAGASTGRLARVGHSANLVPLTMKAVLDDDHCSRCSATTIPRRTAHSRPHPRRRRRRPPQGARPPRWGRHRHAQPRHRCRQQRAGGDPRHRADLQRPVPTRSWRAGRATRWPLPT
jgi:hypothetical protein